MMQKRTIYLSLLLASFLLVFAYSSGYTQNSVVVESKSNLPRCSDVILNVTVNNTTDISAFEIILTLDGSYSNLSVNFDAGLTVLPGRVLQIFGSPDTIRMAAIGDPGDNRLPAGSHVVAQIHLKTGDVCSGTITVSGATFNWTTPCSCPMSASTGFVGASPIAALAATVTPGTVTTANVVPSITCPGNQMVHWGDVVSFDFTAGDNDLANGCEVLTFGKSAGPGTVTKVGPNTGHYVWTTGGEDVCNHTVTLTVTDKCGATAECSFNICVTNTPPAITYDPADTIFAVWGITLSGQVNASDPDHGPSALLYQLVSFNGPTSYGDGFQLNANTGAWTWDIGNNTDYQGNFTLCLKVSDGANVCDPCSPTNADTACYVIHVTGFTIWVEKVHQQLQGHYTTASIYLDSAFVPAGFTSELIGGFDFLIAYDPSALNFIKADPGALIDDGAFEYFTYRMGPFGNCGSGCPSGMVRIVGMREYNNGVINPNHVAGPGQLVILTFYVTNDRTFECQFVPIRFYWLDCGDNTLSDESGNFTYLGLKVFDFTGEEITDPVEYGYSGPMADCFDTVYTHDQLFKNAPLGAIIYRDGGIDIICSGDIDDRGDVNLNGIPNEIGDAVVFTNYFIAGLAAFTINEEGQIAATDVNADGIVLSVADLVYLIRSIVGDVQAIPKVSPYTTTAHFMTDGSVVSVDKVLGGAYFVFDGQAKVSLADGASNVDLKTGILNGNTVALVIDQSRATAFSGNILNTNGTIKSVQASDVEGNLYKTVVVPATFSIRNYPNPFNPSTAIELALPVASDWTLSIYNVAGQKVFETSGYSEAGTHQVEWNAMAQASGIYFYKVDAGQFSATKKMVLLK